MSQELDAFFSQVTHDQALQEQLYHTKELADVAAIARSLGFSITGADILRAQAGRILKLSSEELKEVASGKKAKTGAQWGRGGKGYLDSAGFWVNEVMKWGYVDLNFDLQLKAFLARVQKENTIKTELLLAKSFEDIADIASKYGYEVSGSTVLRYQAHQILKLTEEEAEKVASETR